MQRNTFSKDKIIQQRKRFFFPKANPTATNSVLISKDKSYSNDNVFLFQRQVMQQRKGFSSPKTNHTATKPSFISKTNYTATKRSEVPLVKQNSISRKILSETLVVIWKQGDSVNSKTKPRPIYK